MKTKDIIAGLTILDRQYHNGGYGTSAEHDAIYHYAVDLSAGEVAKLLELGWFQENGAIRAEDSNDGVARPYDPEEGWTAFV
jgi:hypothetical protein